MSGRAGAEQGEKTRIGDVEFTALDWVPHVNRSGAAVVILRWLAVCDLCGARWMATSPASKRQMPSPYRCKGAH
jgi:hypothetical protein